MNPINSLGRFRNTRPRHFKLQYGTWLKASVTKVFKTFLMILPLCGLIYQVQIIYDQYMSGKTIISLEVGRVPIESPPAITLCMPLISMERAGLFKPGFREINEKYQELLKNKSNYMRQIYELYNHLSMNYTGQILKNGGLDMYELFDKISVKYKAIDGTYLLWFQYYKR